MSNRQHTIGLGSERLSSRVLKPPGGGSSDIFGPADDEPAPVRANNRGASSLVLGDESAPSAPSAPAAESAAEPAEEENGEAPAQQETAAGEPDPASAGDGTAPPQQAANDVPKARRQPPGGHSTPLW